MMMDESLSWDGSEDSIGSTEPRFNVVSLDFLFWRFVPVLGFAEDTKLSSFVFRLGKSEEQDRTFLTRFDLTRPQEGV